MRTSAVAGIVFANSNDNLLKRLTSHRSMASVPFGGRYRLIDFALSNLVNAGITNVGIITKENYRSLMDHVGSGIYWDLDRKNGGLYILPPYIESGIRRYSGTIDALHGAKDYIKRCKSDYIVICNGDVLANVDISSAIEQHIDKQADVTVVYHNGKLLSKSGETMVLSLNGENHVSNIELDCKSTENVNFSIGITIIGRKLLTKLIEEAHGNDLASFNRDVLAKRFKKLKIYGFEHSDYVAFMSSTDSYYKTNMDLLDPQIRHQLFNKQRPIYTKVRNSPPTLFGPDSKIESSLFADGCIIEGRVENSIIFRGVKIGRGSVVKNSILFEDTVIGNSAELNCVITDKNTTVRDNRILSGHENIPFYIDKGKMI